MSVMNCNFYSKCLMNFVDVTVYIPSAHNGEAMFASLEDLYAPKQYKTVYLLHGMLDDHSCWMRWSRVEEYAEAHQIALIMPSGQNGFYVNAVHGLKYYDFIHYELPMWAEHNFPLLTGKENRFIAGLSMGGYGALRHGLSGLDQYAAIGAFSPACDVIALNDVIAAAGMGGIVDYDSIYGGIDKVAGTENDVYALLEQAKESGKELPKIYMGCGTDDFIVYAMTKKMQQDMKDMGYDVTYTEYPGEGHTWNVWDPCIKAFLDMIDPK